MNLDDFLDRFEYVRRTFGGYQARCPAHEDRVASLSINDGEDRILIYCHAGCNARDIVEKMGLRLKDLYYDQEVVNELNIGWYNKQPEAIYDYQDVNGTLLYQVLRFPGKRFRQRRLTDKGWVWNMDGVKKVPYNLPELYNSKYRKTIYIVEGEKDVERLKSISALATCFVGGAGKGKFLARYVKYFIYFIDRNVVIIPDLDEPGLAYAEEIKDALTGVAAVTIKRPTKGKDISEHLDNGGTLEDLSDG